MSVKILERDEKFQTNKQIYLKEWKKSNDYKVFPTETEGLKKNQ